MLVCSLFSSSVNCRYLLKFHGFVSLALAFVNLALEYLVSRLIVLHRMGLHYTRCFGLEDRCQVRRIFAVFQPVYMALDSAEFQFEGGYSTV